MIVSPPRQQEPMTPTLLAAIDRFQLQRGTATGSGIILSLATLFPDHGIEIQNITGPDTAIRIAPTTIIDASETVMTCFGPIRSSKRPATNAPIAEITLAATPNSRTSAALIP